jgi:FtsH-binding integral membrane protein
VGVAVFIGLIAYDTQKLKDLSITISDDATVQKRTAIFGALTLYIDFLNLFVSLLRIFGGRR